jgi:hypothetical protein
VNPITPRPPAAQELGKPNRLRLQACIAKKKSQNPRLRHCTVRGFGCGESCSLGSQLMPAFYEFLVFDILYQKISEDALLNNVKMVSMHLNSPFLKNYTKQEVPKQKAPRLQVKICNSTL